jgi:hypothetical protein
MKSPQLVRSNSSEIPSNFKMETLGRGMGGDPGDSFKEKLLKYVPAEAVAFYVPAYAIAKDHGTAWCWTILIIGLVGTILYLLGTADSAKPAHWYFYVLSGVAFLVWAVTTSSVEADLFKLEEWIAEILILIAVFLIPIIDNVVTRYHPDFK